MSDHIYEVEILDNVYEGYGIGRLENGKVVFIPFTVAGDIVEANIVKEKHNFSYGEVVSIKKYSSNRTDNFCKYTGICGGCLFAFLKDDFEKDVKIKILNNLFRNIDDFKIDKFISSNPNEYRLRAKFKIFDSKIGYYKFGTHEFVKIDQCPVVKSSIFEKASQVARSFRTEKITEMSIIENEKGEELIYVDTEDDLPIKDGFNIKTKHQQIGVDKIYIKTGNFNIPTTYGSFFQTNRYILEDFQQEVVSKFADSYRILELYGGSGFFTIPLTASGKRVTSYEIDKSANRLLSEVIGEKRAKLLDIDKDVDKIHFNYDAVLLNPGRKGLTNKVVNYLNTHKPGKIVYVSCNPAALARDVKKLSENFELKGFVIVDQFPKTYHIESIATLDRIV